MSASKGSDSQPRQGRVPRGIARVPLPHLERILHERGHSKRWATAQLGVSPTMFAENTKKGWPQPDAERLAALLHVPMATLSAQGPTVDAPPTVATLLTQLEVSGRYAAAREAILDELDTLVRDVVASTVDLVTRGRVAVTPPAVPAPDPHPRRDELHAIATGATAGTSRRKASGQR